MRRSAKPVAAEAMPLRIGLTGGIGSGKSTVAAMLEGHGAALVDTDAIARSLTLAGGAAMAAIENAFGPGYIAADGSLDRARMRDAAFADASVKARLEAILHPAIGEQAEREAQAAAAAPLIVFDIPLLVESGRWRARVDRVWVVDCSEALQVSRVMMRSGWTEGAVRAVIARQASRPARRAAADAVIHNEAISQGDLAARVATLYGHAITREKSL